MALNISTQYLYSNKGPFDAKMLVTTYDQLLKTETWSGYVYNGMIVAVGRNTTDLTKNGIYYLHDATVTNALKTPDVTVASNWHKIAELDELEALRSDVTSLTSRITALEANGGSSGGTGEGVTEAYVQSQLEALTETIEATYATKAALNTVEAKIPSLDGYAKTEYVDDQVANLATSNSVDQKVATVQSNVDSLTDTLQTNYYTKSATDAAISKAINEASISGGDTEIDLSIYATKEDLNAYAKQADLESVQASVDQKADAATVVSHGESISELQTNVSDLDILVANKANTSELDNYTLKSDYQTLQDTVSDVQDTLADKANVSDIPTDYITKDVSDLTHYYTSNVIDSTLAEYVTTENARVTYATIATVENKANTTYVDDELAKKVDTSVANETYATKNEVSTTLSSYATTSSVNSAISNATAGLATSAVVETKAEVAYVDESVAALDKKVTDADYASKSYVTDKIADMASGGEITLDGYVKTEDLATYATEAEVDAKVNVVDEKIKNLNVIQYGTF